MEQLEKRELLAAHPAGLGGGYGGDELPGVKGEEGLLGLDAGIAEAEGPQGVGEPVPADMAGEVLPAGGIQEVVSLDMAPVRPSRALRGRLRDLLPGFPVVESEKEAPPGLLGQLPCQRRSRKRRVDHVALRGGIRERGRGRPAGAPRRPPPPPLERGLARSETPSAPHLPARKRNRRNGCASKSSFEK